VANASAYQLTTAGAEMPLANDIISHPQHAIFEKRLIACVNR